MLKFIMKLMNGVNIVISRYNKKNSVKGRGGGFRIYFCKYFFLEGKTI